MARTLPDLPIRYSPMGDSLTKGFFASSQDKSFVSQLCSLILTNKGKKIVADGSGIPGGTLANGLTAVNTVNSKYPDFITIEYGTNDAGATPTDQTLFRSQLNQMIDGISTNVNRKPFMVLVTTWNQGATGDQFDAIIKDVAQQRGLPVVDVKALYQNPANKGPAGVSTPFGTSDTFHPNDTGMTAIAQAIYDTINASLNIKSSRMVYSNRQTYAGRNTASNRLLA